MEQSFDILTTVVSGTAVLLLVVTAIHASARLLQMTFGKKSGLNRKDTAKSNKAVKNTETAKLPEKKEEPPGIDKRCAIYKEKYLTCKPLAKRTHVYIEQENVNLIKQLLWVIEPNASISGYINNIVKGHLEKCKPEIMKLYKEKKADDGN
ncbi:MAG: DUF3408 domain-containing protein [Bacteroides sp.]|nr:DUF3408 domain-containing protein [Bacteroides sp.]MCM1388776.1 DUF3408 domain-containing protein [Bacteroides sp.]